MGEVGKVMYRVSDEQIQAEQAEYKKRYKPFKPFTPTDRNRAKMAAAFMNLVTTQNGMDTDDYCVGDNNKVERYLSDLTKGSRVLLLGTGTGREVLVAKEMGLVPVGTTLGSRNINFGVDELGLAPNELIECLNEDLPFPSGSFDCVAGFQVFEHTLAPLLFLLEQSRVLKIGGRLMLEWPPADKFSMEDNPHHQVCFSFGQARALFQKAGFSDIKLYYDDMSPVSEEDVWREDQDKMLCIEGVKSVPSKDYIIRAQGL